ncbi:MAG: Smr/MutS family protein [Burkholderiales bacterium]|nr:Smr/MutS family protein [Burkholderiales bacterium]
MTPSDEEFLRAVADVRPLDPPRRLALRPPAPAPLALQRRRDERAALAESLAGRVSIDDTLDSGEEFAYAADGVPRQTLRKLRRGHWVVEASLDLHGQRRMEAAASVAAFLGEAVAAGRRCVRIVHGKGLGSPNREPVLKSLLRKWLPRRDEVLACCQAPAAHGGAGALLVLLKARARR